MVSVFPAMTPCVDYATRAYIDLASDALLTGSKRSDKTLHGFLPAFKTRAEIQQAA